MDRRGFLKASALAAASSALKPSNAMAQSLSRDFTLKNGQLAWYLQSNAEGVRSIAFENRITGRRFELKADNEFRLIFSAGKRIEIPWWEFRLTDETAIEPERESGLLKGFHQYDKTKDGWIAVDNLAGGQHGRAYGGYGWFRCNVELPVSAQGQEIVLVLGGYDEQDWNDYWVYLNGRQIGTRTSSGRWREPGRFALKPSEAAYASLNFGAGSSNLLAVRTRGYELRLKGATEKQIDRYVFRPWLFDQFVSVGEPFLPVSRFELRGSHQEAPDELVLDLYSPETKVSVAAHYELQGPVRRKWLEIRNDSGEERLLLDLEMDAFQMESPRTEGGHGDPVFLDEEAFLAIEHPSGINKGADSGIRLWHSPGKRIQPNATLNSHASVVGVTSRGQVLDQFHNYVIANSPRRRNKHISLYTCYGINNQWGGCPALTDEETLDCQKVVKSWQDKGVKLDYFTIDQGWPDDSGDLTQFTPSCYPDGPARIVEGVKALGMKLGLWFSVSGGGWSDGSYPAIQSSAIPAAGGSIVPPTEPPVWAYRNGYPTVGGIGRPLCIASDPYFNVFKHAVEHHVRNNEVRLVKLDIGEYYCNSIEHGHLPGRYSTEAMFEHLIAISAAARAIDPDVFVTWYWGVGTSPFWALHGNVIFESGLFLEGSGTSWYPSLFYRDSVTLALDQSTVFAKMIPPLLKDSLGVWLSQIRWANFMGKKRWREALVMDLGRGNLIFPQIWGDPNLLNDDDLSFLSEMISLSQQNEKLLQMPRRNLGDVWKNEPYGYAYFDGSHGLIFLNNVSFTARKLRIPLSSAVGFSGLTGTRVQVTSIFPERAKLIAGDGQPFETGATVEIWLRPFETMLIEIGSSPQENLPLRHIDASSATEYGTALLLQQIEQSPWMDLTFADAEAYEKAAMRPHVQGFSSKLPDLPAGRSILAIHVRLSKDGEEYRYSPTVAGIVQIRARIGGHDFQLIPVPDPRQYGNTQHAGCSWVVYKVPLSQGLSQQSVEFSVHSYLPAGVEAITEAWTVKEWWHESTRPEAEGYYGDEPS